jgi:hypothetical protein
MQKFRIPVRVPEWYAMGEVVVMLSMSQDKVSVASSALVVYFHICPAFTLPLLPCTDMYLFCTLINFQCNLETLNY